MMTIQSFEISSAAAATLSYFISALAQTLQSQDHLDHIQSTRVITPRHPPTSWNQKIFFPSQHHDMLLLFVEESVRG